MTAVNSTTDVKITCDPATGRFIAAYLTIRPGQSVRTVEVAEGAAFADYDADGQLLGIEAVAPCEISAPNRWEDRPIPSPRPEIGLPQAAESILV